jgi:hypothetical protein
MSLGDQFSDSKGHHALPRCPQHLAHLYTMSA